MQLGEQVAGTFRRYFWNRTTLSAMLIASPAILSSLGTFAMSNSLDRRIARFSAERDTLNRDLGALDGHTRSFETLQLGRGAFLLVMNGATAEMQYKYLLDRLFRQNAKQAVRRITAIVHPGDWQARMAAYDALVDQEYSDAGTVRNIQALESAMVQEAGAHLTALQLRHNIVSGRIDKIESLKGQLTAVIASLTSALTIVIFFITTSRKKPEAAKEPAKANDPPR
ncbi:MAG: hypothetical protein J0I67_13440 [Bosea sp.]|nr:hypothetical protein [Bosea sp. (in: a-proteobacteria)]